MATQVVTPEKTAARFTVNSLEVASTDLYVADALLLAATNFLDEIRQWTMPGGVRPDESVFDNSKVAQTLLGELRDKIQNAKVTIDFSVEAAIQDGLGRSAE